MKREPIAVIDLVTPIAGPKGGRPLAPKAEQRRLQLASGSC